MRILVDARHLSTGGTGGVVEYTRRLLPALFAQAPQDAFVLLTSGMAKPSLEAWTRLPNVEHRHLPFPNKTVNGMFWTAGLPGFERAFGVEGDALFLPNLAFVPLYETLPTVLTVHDLTWRLLPECFSAKMRLWHAAVDPRRLVSRAGRILVPSASTAQDLIRGFPDAEDRVRVVPHGVDPAFSPTKSPSDHGVRSRLRLPPRYALFVGTVEPRKNLPIALEAMRTYRSATGDRLPLLVAGAAGWHAKPILKKIDEARRDGLARWLRSVPAADLPALYRGAEALVWPSKYEGFGLPPLEAMASGIPVVTSAVSSLPEVCGDAALLVNPENPADVAAALRAVLRDPILNTRLRQAGPARAKECSWQKSAEVTHEALQAAAHGKTA